MTVGGRKRSTGPEHRSATLRLTRARDRQERLVARLAPTACSASAQAQLSAGRADVASCEEWLHWIERAETLEPWADGEWDPRHPGPAADAAAPAASEAPREPVGLTSVLPGDGRAGAAASWIAPALPRCVGQLGTRLAEFARSRGVEDPVVADLRLAASEAITNVVLHAYRSRGMPGMVTASMRVDGPAGRLELDVVDDGVGMSPRGDSPGAGLGLHIIERLSDSMTICAGTGGLGTEVRMVFTLSRQRVA